MTPLDSQTFSSIFVKAPTMVERVVKFDSLGTAFIPRIFEAKDWLDLFGNFEDPIDELNWVQGKSLASIQTTLQRFFLLIDW